MGSISLRNAGLVATETLFSNLNLVIGDGDRVGLVAGNGRGKTTLLKAMAGQGELTSGDIVRSRGLQVGYVEQDMPTESMGLTLYEAVLEALPVATPCCWMSRPTIWIWASWCSWRTGSTRRRAISP